MVYSFFIVVLYCILYRVMSQALGCPKLTQNNHKWTKGVPGQNVDWFVILKDNGGKDYLYADSSVPKLNSFHKLGDVLDPLSEAVKRINKHKYALMFNDQYKVLGGRNTQAPHPHSKGFMGWTNDQGLFITHSVPDYPGLLVDKKTVKAKLEPKNEALAQHFLCITMTAANSEMLKEAVAFEHFATRFHGFYLIKQQGHRQPLNSGIPGILGVKDEKLPKRHEVEFKATEVGPWQVISKHVPDNKSKGSLFEYVMEIYDKPFYIRTHSRSKGLFDDECGPYNIESLRVKTLEFPDQMIQLSEGGDHSKWAISDKGDVSCFCDLNRKCPQRKRGGSCFCLRNQNLHDEIGRLIDQSEVQKCRKKFHCF